jgi:hypothetical protein
VTAEAGKWLGTHLAASWQLDTCFLAARRFDDPAWAEIAGGHAGVDIESRLKAQHSDPVHHHPDRQPGQPRHPSPHSVSILAAIHISRKTLELASLRPFTGSSTKPKWSSMPLMEPSTVVLRKLPACPAYSISPVLSTQPSRPIFVSGKIFLCLSGHK